jgi:D-alanyl-D-alanine carboxypeptidase
MIQDRKNLGARFSLRLFHALAGASFLFLIFATPGQAKYASLVMDADSGRVLHEVNADTRNYPASLTKMMTLYLVFDGLNEGTITLNQRLKVTARAARQPASKLGLRRGETITVEQAILALVTKSANDVATVIAENLSRSERDFALVMTARARQLGMARTTFRNASGLPHRGQLSTARDMSILARALINDHPGYYRYFSTSQFIYKGIKNRNHNAILKSYQGADGVKTGYIRASGFNLVASAVRGGRRLIGVVFGGKSSKRRNRHMVKLLDKGFRLIDPALMVAEKKKPKTEKKKTVAAAKPRRIIRNDPGTDGQWGIQVGAYAKYAPAYKIAVKAVEKAPKYLNKGMVQIVPLNRRNKKPLYRARIVGLDKRQAYRACERLERGRMSCMELRTKGGVRLASAKAPQPAIKATVKSSGNSSSKGKWGIQVGVYAGRGPARAIAEKAAGFIPSLLENGFIKVEPLDRGRRKTYYRGRILGISKGQAYAACRTLKKRKMSCMEMRLKGDLQLAQTD